ncbi:MAG: hypothetical protein VX573_02910 [Bacteroidota bacterium]|nr:hypothetical protein [Bacteroidota bacterium]
MTINSKSIFLRRVEEAFLLKRINKKTATHFKIVYNKFDAKKRSAADDRADELLLELIAELKVKIPNK